MLVNGALESGAAFNIVVDWVSPTKVRRTRVLGERGMLEADTLTADLYFYENADVDVSVVDRPAVPRGQRGQRHPLRPRAPRAARGWSSRRSSTCSRATSRAEVVSLDDGVEIVRVAEAVLRQRRRRPDGGAGADRAA